MVCTHSHAYICGSTWNRFLFKWTQLRIFKSVHMLIYVSKYFRYKWQTLKRGASVQCTHPRTRYNFQLPNFFYDLDCNVFPTKNHFNSAKNKSLPNSNFRHILPASLNNSVTSIVASHSETRESGLRYSLAFFSLHIHHPLPRPHHTPLGKIHLVHHSGIFRDRRERGVKDVWVLVGGTGEENLPATAAVHKLTQSQTRRRQPSMHACIGEGNGNPLQYSCLENPRDWGAWWAAIYGVARSRTRLKRLSSSSRDAGSIPGLGRSLGGGNPLLYSCWENPTDRGAWWATVHGVAKSRDMTENTHSNSVRVIHSTLNGAHYSKTYGLFITVYPFASLSCDLWWSPLHHSSGLPKSPR